MSNKAKEYLINTENYSERDIDYNTNISIKKVIGILESYHQYRLKEDMPSDEEIQAKVNEHEAYHLNGMSEAKQQFNIEFYAGCCGNSFYDAIRWLKNKLINKSK